MFFRRKNAFGHMAVQPMETSQRQFLFEFEFYFPMVSDFDRADATISQVASARQRQEASEKTKRMPAKRNIFTMIVRPCVSRAK